MLVGNMVFSVVLSASSAALLLYLRGQAADPQQASANAWPFVLGLALLVFSAMVAIQYAIQHLKTKSRSSHVEPEGSGGDTITMLAIVIASIAYIASLQFIGHILGTYVFLLLCFYLLGVKERLKLFGLPLLMVAIYTVGFSMLLYIPLPRGVGIFRTLSEVFR